MKYRYREPHEMKDSGVEWLGTIPREWEVSKLKYFVSYKKGKNPKQIKEEYQNGYFPYLSTEYLRKNICNTYTLYDSNLCFAEEGDFLLLWDGANAGEIFNAKEGIVSSTMAKLFFNKFTQKKFGGYFLKYLELHLRKTTIGMGIPHVNSEILKNLPWNIVELKVQQKIADFLDLKCGEFDSIIEKKESLITKLEEAKKSLISEVVTGKVKVIEKENGSYEIGKREPHEMKDSGVEWLGMIPREWEVKKIKYLFELRNERNKLEMSDVEILSLYTALGVKKQNEIEYRTGNKVFTVEDYKIAHPNDVVVNIILAWMGAIGVSAYKGVISPAYDIYKPISDIKVWYYHYLFRTSKFSGECYKQGRGIMAMRWRTYSDEFKSIFVPVPSKIEQSKILSALDYKIKNFDSTIEKQKELIEKLKKAKQSLISEAVTGKIEVL